MEPVGVTVARRGQGRGVMTAALYNAGGVRVATLVHEGQAVRREQL